MKASKPYATTLAFWILFILLVVLFWGILRKDESSKSTPLNPSLETALENAFDQTKGRYGIFIKNLKTGEGYKLNENLQFEAGSLYKIYLMSNVFEKIKEGQLNADAELEEDIAGLNRKFNISSDEAELREGKINLTVEKAIEQMITISHNYAALILLNKVGSSGIPTKVTAYDVALFFERLYKGEIINKDYSKRMIDILSRQKITDRIPKYLPDVKIAHKTGDIGYFEHDGGIVFSPKSDYIIVVLTEFSSPADADESIAQISKVAFDYFSRK